MIHEMKLNPGPFDAVNERRKHIELRLYDEKRRTIQVGDTIVFTHTKNSARKLEVSVAALHLVDSFAKLFEKVDPAAGGFAGLSAKEAALAMRRYYSEDREKKWGVVGIEMSLENETPSLLGEYKNLIFRQVLPGDAETAAAIEAICFPPSEACTLPIMKERAAWAADAFLVAARKETGELVGFVNGLCTNDRSLEDELFTNTSLHDPHGANVMICSVSVLPEYRLQGIARAMMSAFLAWQKEQGKCAAILTCVPGKISMYEKFGYSDCGRSASTWGGEVWHEMRCDL